MPATASARMYSSLTSPVIACAYAETRAAEFRIRTTFVYQINFDPGCRARPCRYRHRRTRNILPRLGRPFVAHQGESANFGRAPRPLRSAMFGRYCQRARAQDGRGATEGA
eukprot:890174-Prorocentrum_minimum.AAC.2